MNEQHYQSTVDDIVAKRAIRPDMLQDLHVIACLTENTCEQIAESLQALQGLKTSDAIEVAVRNCFTEEELSKAESVVNALGSLEPDEIDHLVDTLKAWVSAKESRKEVFSDSILIQLAKNLKVLISDYPAVELMQKADQLLRAVGNELKNVKFVCDLRPVFDNPRASVEGFVLVANMRLIYVSQDGSRHTCEIALTEEELGDIREKADQALSKLSVLNDVRSTLSVNSSELRNAK